MAERTGSQVVESDMRPLRKTRRMLEEVGEWAKV